MRNQYFKQIQNADYGVAILGYSITSRASLRVVQDFYAQMKLDFDTDYLPIVLIGNKCDLEHMREV
jgi:GTPase SAR1 family protein